MPDAPSVTSSSPSDPTELVVVVCRDHICTGVDGQIDRSRKDSVEMSGRPRLLVDEFRNDIGNTLSSQELDLAIKEARVKAAPFLYRDIEDLDGCVTGGELLARVLEFKGQEFDIGTPGCFGKAADESGAWLKIDLKMIENAAYYSSRIENFIASVNISAQVLRSACLESTIQSLIDEEKLIPQNLCLEILETIDALTPDDIALLRRLREKGVRLAIDDFGEDQSEVHFDRLIEADIELYAIKIPGDITRDIMTDDQAEIKQWLKKAADVKPELIVFEGGGKGEEKTKITRPLIGRLKTLKNKMGSQAKWVVQGPVVEDEAA